MKLFLKITQRVFNNNWKMIIILVVTTLPFIFIIAEYMLNGFNIGSVIGCILGTVIPLYIDEYKKNKNGI